MSKSIILYVLGFVAASEMILRFAPDIGVPAVAIALGVGGLCGFVIAPFPLARGVVRKDPLTR